MNRGLRIAAFALIAAAPAILTVAYRTATADPVIREAHLAILPPGERPLHVLLLSDIHVAGPDMPPERLAHLVAIANAQRPDLVLIAGDFVSDKRTATRFYAFDPGTRPLAALRPRLGVVAVLGNHDHWRSTRQAHVALAKAGVRLLDNQAIRVGPLAIGGLDDAFTRQANLPATIAAMDRVGGVPILLSHSPDPFPAVPASVPVMLAGHTHCGQIRLPIVGAVATMSAYGDRYACGIVREGEKTLIVSAGLGTSLLPLRLGAVPDMWLVTLTPRQASPRGLAAP